MRADRLLSIVVLLQARGKMTAQALAEHLEVSERTILRDIQALSFAGIPVTTEGGHGGGIALDKHYRVSLAGLNEGERRALFLADTPRPLHDMGLTKAAEGMLLKLFAALPVTHQEEVDWLRQRIHLDSVWWGLEERTTPWVDVLERAVFTEQRIQAQYQRGSGEIVERTLNPYGLVAKGNTWYLVAEHDALWRTYRVSRFTQVTLVDEPFQRDHAFDLPTHWREHCQEFAQTWYGFACTLALAPQAAQRLAWLAEIQMARVQIDGTEPDGWARVTITMNSQEAACFLVMRLGAEVRILAPTALQEAVCTSARTVLAQHGG